MLGAQGVADRMAEIGRRLNALTPPAPRTSPGFAQMLDTANAAGPLVPTTLGPNPLSGAIGGSSDLRAMAESAAARNDVDPTVFKALVAQESGWNPGATSKVGAKGLCQLMDGTAKDLGVTDPYDPAQSLEGGAKYLRRMLDVNHGDVSRALASYNAGFGRVNGRSPGEWPRETQDYVTRILNHSGGSV